MKKSNRHTGKMTEALFLEAAEGEEKLKEQGERRLNVSGVLKRVGVSRSGYMNGKKRLPSQRELRKQAIKERISPSVVSFVQRIWSRKMIGFVKGFALMKM